MGGGGDGGGTPAPPKGNVDAGDAPADTRNPSLRVASEGRAAQGVARRARLTACANPPVHQCKGPCEESGAAPTPCAHWQGGCGRRGGARGDRRNGGGGLGRDEACQPRFDPKLMFRS